MKRFALLCLLALTLGAVGWANIIPILPVSGGVTGTGPYTFNYQFQLSSDQTVPGGGAPPTVNPVPDSAPGISGFVTIYDFWGYIPASCVGPTGWACTTQFVGFTPGLVNPPDATDVVNITWAYIGTTPISGGANGTNLGQFTAQSIYGQLDQIYYASRALKNNGLGNQTIGSNVGQTGGPLGTPEPVSMGMLGLGLVSLGLLRRKVKSAR
jgi:hypothetical protein